MTPLPAYLGSENRSARLATMLRAISEEVCALCPHRNKAWRVMYLEDGLAYYTAGSCPNPRCELADLLEERLAETFGQQIGLVRLPGELPPCQLDGNLDRGLQTVIK